MDVPIGGPPQIVQRWFDAVAAAAKPDNDGSLAAAHDSARVLSQPRQVGQHPRRLSLGGARLVHLVRPAWSLPAACLSDDVAAFLAAGRDPGQAGNTLKLRAAAIRFLHRAAGLPSPTDTRRGLGNHGRHPSRRPQSPEEARGHVGRPARAAGADPGRFPRVARPRAAAGRFCRRAAPLGARRHPVRDLDAPTRASS